MCYEKYIVKVLESSRMNEWEAWIKWIINRMNGKNEFNIIGCFDCQRQRGRDTSSQTIMFSRFCV